MIVGGSLLLAYHFIFRPKQSFKRKDWPLFAKVAFFHIYLSFMPEFWAMQFMSSAKTVLMFSATPFISAIIGYYMLNHRLTIKKIIGLIIGFIGLVPVVIIQASPHEFTGELFRFSIPEAMLFVAAFGCAYGWFLVKDLLEKGYTVIMINGISMFFGGLGALATSLIVEGIDPSPVFQLGPFLLWATLLLIVANIVVYNFHGWLIERYSIIFVSFAGFLAPIFGAIYGSYFLGEQITWHYFISFVMIFFALSIFYQDELAEAG